MMGIITVSSLLPGVNVRFKACAEKSASLAEATRYKILYGLWLNIQRSTIYQALLVVKQSLQLSVISSVLKVRVTSVTFPLSIPFVR